MKLLPRDFTLYFNFQHISQSVLEDNALLNTSHCSVALYLNKMSSNYETAVLMLVLHSFWRNTNGVKTSLVREPDSDRLHRISPLAPLFRVQNGEKKLRKSSACLATNRKIFLFALSNTPKQNFQYKISLQSLCCYSKLSATVLLRLLAFQKSSGLRIFSGDSTQEKLSTASLQDTAFSEYLTCFFKK